MTDFPRQSESSPFRQRADQECVVSLHYLDDSSSIYIIKVLNEEALGINKEHLFPQSSHFNHDDPARMVHPVTVRSYHAVDRVGRGSDVVMCDVILGYN